MIIARNRYLNKLIERKNNGMIKVITGIRRCGKSFLLFNLYYDYLKLSGIKDKQIVKISLDENSFAEQRDPDELLRYIYSKIDDKNSYYIFIDEVQYAINKEELKNKDKPIKLYGVLNELMHKNNVDVYVTGSNSKFLSSDVMTEFRGRGDEIHLAPLSFSEYFAVSKKDKQEAYVDYATYGGMPYILSGISEENKIKYLQNLNIEIYIKDIVDRYDIKDEEAMEKLMKVVASSIGSLINPLKISKTFNSNNDKTMSEPTIKNYLKYLQDVFVLQKAERYDVKGRKYISTPSKYYYTDLGLRNAILNFRQFELTHIMENIIYNELIYRGYNVDVGVVENNIRIDGVNLKKQLEVDFICNLGNKRYYVQSAFSISDEEKMKQEEASLIKINDSFKKIIVVNDNIKPYITENGITIMNIIDFLLDENSLNL